jgi:hypothetical protein
MVTGLLDFPLRVVEFASQIKTALEPSPTESNTLNLWEIRLKILNHPMATEVGMRFRDRTCSYYTSETWRFLFLRKIDADYFALLGLDKSIPITHHRGLC